MKKMFAMVMCLLTVLSLSACRANHTKTASTTSSTVPSKETTTTSATQSSTSTTTTTHIKTTSSTTTSTQTAKQTTPDNNHAQGVKYAYEGIKGLYRYTSETVTNEFGMEYAALYFLCLEENGTFSYKMGTGAICGHIGNYIIKDNTIFLNYLFSTDNGTGLYATTGSKTITIVGKDKLLDAQPSVTVGNMKEVLLKKVSTEEEKEYLQYVSVSHLLSNYDIMNNASENH